MSNGESKIAIFKAALCYGFAIALRALFLEILQEATYLSLRASVRTRGNQQARNLDTVDCHEAKASRNDTIKRSGQPNTFDCFTYACNDNRNIGYAPLIAAPIPP